MAHMLIRHKVADFEIWKPAYDEHRPERVAAGLTDLHLWRNEADPNEVFVLFETTDLPMAKAFADSTHLKEKMRAAGVQGPPDIVFLAES